MAGKILIKMSGSIAAYKICYLISKLVQNKYEVQVVASASTFEFVGKASLEGLSGRPVVSDLFEDGHMMGHIHLIRWADLVLVAPATAHFLNRTSQGIGDDLLTTLFLAHDFKKPYLVAPAMNTMMYLHPVTQGSMTRLKSMGISILETASGVLACGENGWGRLLDPDLIFAEIQSALKTSLADSNDQLSSTSPNENGLKNHKSLKVLITSGGTSEQIDAVRKITNMSTGQTGAYIAELFSALGFEVDFLCATNSFKPKGPIHVTEFYSYKDIQESTQKLLQENAYDAVVFAAAISDYRVHSVEGANWRGQKISSEHQQLNLVLHKNSKIIDTIKSSPKNKNTYLVGFKLTIDSTAEQEQASVQKLMQESLADLVVHNDWAKLQQDASKHPASIFVRQTGERIETENKQQLAQNLARLIIEKAQQSTKETTQ